MFRKGCTNTYLRPVSYIFLAISLTITMVSFCTSSWYSTMKRGRIINQGIWNVCDGSEGGWPFKCDFLPEPKTGNELLIFDIHPG